MKDEIMSLLTDFGEFTLDSFLQDGMIKELPILGSAFSMLKIGVLDYDGQTEVLFNSQTNKIESPPSIIVALNGYSDFLKELLQKLN